MKDILKKLANQTSVYGISSVLVRVIPFLLIIVHTGVLNAASYGVYNELYTWIILLLPLYYFGMETTYFRFSVDYKGDTIYKQAGTLILLISLILSTCIYFFSSNIASLFGYDGYAQYIQCLSLILFLDALASLPLARLRHKNKPVHFATIRILNVISNVVIQLFFLLLCPWWIENYPISMVTNWIQSFYNPDDLVFYIILSNVFSSTLTILLLSKDLLKIRLVWNKKLISKMLFFAYPILLIGIAGGINERLDNLMVKWWLTVVGMTADEVIGVYGACARLSVILLLVVQGFRYASEPLFFSSSKSKNAKELYSIVLTFFTLITSGAMVLIIMNIDWLAPLFIRQTILLKAIEILPFLLLARLLFGIYSNTTIWFKLKKKTYIGAIITIIGTCIFVSTTYLFIPILHFFAPPIAACICFLSMIIINMIISRKTYYVQYDWSKIALIIVINIVLICIFQRIPFHLPIFFPILLSIVYSGLLFFVGYKMYNAIK